MTSASQLGWRFLQFLIVTDPAPRREAILSVGVALLEKPRKKAVKGSCFGCFRQRFESNCWYPGWFGWMEKHLQIIGLDRPMPNSWNPIVDRSALVFFDMTVICFVSHWIQRPTWPTFGCLQLVPAMVSIPSVVRQSFAPRPLFFP